ncbi:3916_t:CDS:2, partial [Entrophospora sp. SA101]
LHPTVDSFFPVTKQYLQEYIDAKKKQGTIKANSLDQYFQHIESYNMALNYGWESQEFEPMMRENGGSCFPSLKKKYQIILLSNARGKH